MMFESAAICLQLADLNPDAGLIPPVGSAERALVYQWVLFGMTELEGPLFGWIGELGEGVTASPARDRFAQAATALESALGVRQWLLDDQLTVAEAGPSKRQAQCCLARTQATSSARVRWPPLSASRSVASSPTPS